MEMNIILRSYGKGWQQNSRRKILVSSTKKKPMKINVGETFRLIRITQLIHLIS